MCLAATPNQNPASEKNDKEKVIYIGAVNLTLTAPVDNREFLLVAVLKFNKSNFGKKGGGTQNQSVTEALWVKQLDNHTSLGAAGAKNNEAPQGKQRCSIATTDLSQFILPNTASCIHERFPYFVIFGIQGWWD